MYSYYSAFFSKYAYYPKLFSRVGRSIELSTPIKKMKGVPSHIYLPQDALCHMQTGRQIVKQKCSLKLSVQLSLLKLLLILLITKNTLLIFLRKTISFFNRCHPWNIVIYYNERTISLRSFKEKKKKTATFYNF